MKAVFQNLMERHSPLPGLGAWAARLPGGGVVVSHSYADGFNARQLEEAVNRLAAISGSLRAQGIEPVEQCWVFERVRVCLAVRADGACLALFVENRPDPPRAKLERVLHEFLGLGGNAT